MDPVKDDMQIPEVFFIFFFKVDCEKWLNKLYDTIQYHNISKVIIHFSFFSIRCLLVSCMKTATAKMDLAWETPPSPSKTLQSALVFI